MKSKILLVLLPVALVLVGCGPVPLVPVTYEEAAVVQSDLSAYVELNTGKVSGHSSSTLVYAGGIYVPVNSGPVPELHFGADDQEAVKRYEVLSSEGDSGWQKWNTNASDGKKKAATKLLNLVIADIQEFIVAAQA